MRRTATYLVAMAALCLLALAASASAAAPQIIKTGFSAVRPDSVVLEAQINPKERPTSYLFEYGLADCSAKTCTKTTLTAIPQGNAPVLVKVKVIGLKAQTTYHFQVVAKNQDGEDKSTDRTFTTSLVPPPFKACPNDQLRGNNPMAALLDYSSANLPDCRAYEQASPVQKNGSDAKGMVVSTRASASGDAVSFVTTSGIPGAEGGQDVPTWLASRNASGWSTQGLLPSALAGQEASIRGWSPDFSQVFSRVRRLGPPNTEAFLARSSVDHSLTEVVPYQGSLGSPSFAGSNPDGSVAIFESNSALLPGAVPGKSNVYLWQRATKSLRLASVLNDGNSPKEGAFAGPYNWISASTPALIGDNNVNFGGSASGYLTQDSRAISADGRNVYFTATGTGELYLRLNASEAQSPLDSGKCTDPAKACTLQVSASQKTDGLGPNGSDLAGPRPAAFMAASADGSTVFFTSPEKLTNDAKTGPEQQPPSIARAEIDGDPVKLDFLLLKAKGVAVFGDHLYWADPVEDTIGRAKLNGAGDATEVDEDFLEIPQIEVETEPGTFELLDANPQYVAADATHLYWTNVTDEEDGHGTIGRAKLGATEAEEVEAECIKGAHNPQGIAVNATHIYWGNLGEDPGNSKLGRANLECSGVDQSLTPFDWKGRGLALTPTHLYFSSDSGTVDEGFVWSIPLANLAQFPNLIIKGSGKILGLAIDSTYLYWTNSVTDKVGRLKLDDTEPAEGDFIEDIGNPRGLALDATHLYWSANQEQIPNPGNDLYRFDAESGELVDLTAGAPGKNGAEVKGVLGASADGSRIYFLANSVLAPGAAAGDCKGFSASENIVWSGQCSLYLSEGDEPPVFITRLEGADDAINWLPYGTGATGVQKTARVSADGQVVLFRSARQLTAYANEGTPELYRYRLGDPAPTCVSCNSSGDEPTGTPRFGSVALSFLFPDSAPAITLSRNLSADGNRVFFETSDALLPADVNGDEGCPIVGSDRFKFPACQDVYEWEAQGTGSCESAAHGGGCLYLLTTGNSPYPSFLADASLSGNDVFLITRSRLVGQDQDQLYDVYDASVNGGLASQSQPPPPVCTSVDGCQGAAQPAPPTETPGTATFSGPGNEKPKPRCPKEKRQVRTKGKTRCVAKGKGKGGKRTKTTRRTSR